MILAPRPSNVALSLSESSFERFSFNTFGAASTNFFASTKLNPNNPLTSLIIFGFDLASNESNLTVKTLLTSTFSSSTSSTGAAGAAAPAPAPAEKETSAILRRVFNSETSVDVSKRFNVAI